MTLQNSSHSTPQDPSTHLAGPLVICGSARKGGNTCQAIDMLLDGKAEVVHLCQKTISYYDYAYGNRGDDFLPLAQQMTKHPVLFFATPVYWYSMSGQMKVFWDRMTDLMYHHKDVLKALRGKPVGLIVSTSHPMPEEFPNPLQATCGYLGLDYQGCWEMRFGEDKTQDDQHNAAQKQAFCQHWGHQLASQRTDA
jgi:hypothetical protein